MTVHKLTAGSGYEYLTRQVAAMDATDKSHSGLADYYEAKGEAPGTWVGSGMTELDGLDAGDAVTAEQMFNLFGLGIHPLADDLEAQHDARTDAEGRRGDARERRRAGWLGKPYAVHRNDATPLQIEVARRVTDAQNVAGGGVVQPEVRARIRTEVARELFAADHGRAPATERELAGYVAQQTRPRTTAVAGYDLTFSPVKSVSTLWAIADPHTAKMIEHAHNFAVADALAFIEDHALFTRTGAGGARQIQTTGLVATAFTHRDSRAGDPDLHTHVAVANKVQVLEIDEHGRQVPGRWLAIDGRVLFKANVAASETYNTRLEHHLTKALGVRFADRPTPGGHLRGAKRQSGKSSVSTPRFSPGGPPDGSKSWTLRRAWPLSSGLRMVVLRRRSRHCTWPSRRTCRLASPSTLHAPSPSSATPGAPRLSRCLMATSTGSTRWSTGP